MEQATFKFGDLPKNIEYSREDKMNFNLLQVFLKLNCVN
jgi:hypothetical protein